MASASGANASSFPSVAVVANSSGSRIPGRAARPLAMDVRARFQNCSFGFGAAFVNIISLT